MLRHKVCQGVKCVEKESELECKVYHATLKQSVAKELSVLWSKVWVSLLKYTYLLLEKTLS